MAVIASFLIGSNGATSLGGLSAPLSTPADRERFLKRHRSAGAFIIGKESARVESYEKTKVPIFIYSRSSAALTFTHPLMQQITVNRDMAELTRKIDSRIDGDIVVEAGASLLQALINEGAIDILELSISPIAGDGNFVERESLLQNFLIEDEKVIDGTTLLKCRYQSDATHR